MNLTKEEQIIEILDAIQTELSAISSELRGIEEISKSLDCIATALDNISRDGITIFPETPE